MSTIHYLFIFFRYRTAEGEEGVHPAFLARWQRWHANRQASHRFPEADRLHTLQIENEFALLFTNFPAFIGEDLTIMEIRNFIRHTAAQYGGYKIREHFSSLKSYHSAVLRWNFKKDRMCALFLQAIMAHFMPEPIWTFSQAEIELIEAMHAQP